MNIGHVPISHIIGQAEGTAVGIDSAAVIEHSAQMLHDVSINSQDVDLARCIGAGEVLDQRLTGMRRPGRVRC